MRRWYREWVFPRLLDRIMNQAQLAPWRIRLLAGLQGRVLEVGFGTGLNLPHYPQGVELVGLEPIWGMQAIAQERISQAACPVSLVLGKVETLPFGDAEFDAVVTAWTLCSLPNLPLALSEIRRVLKPQGEFRFIEHGKSPHPGMARLQTALTPIHKVASLGCHLNRDYCEVEAAGFTLQLEQGRFQGVPSLVAPAYFGLARRA